MTWFSKALRPFVVIEIYDRGFFKALFCNDTYQIGKTLGLAKNMYAGESQLDFGMRHCNYMLTLLGDPEMPIFTDAINPLEVVHTQSVPLGESQISVAVTHDSTPVSDALVCAKQGDTVYAYGLTDNAGLISLYIFISTNDPVSLTVTAHNFLPYETQIPIRVDPLHTSNKE